MPTSRKTIGVIGLGSIGMRHAKNLLAMGHNVVGYDVDGDRMRLLMEQNDPSCEGVAGWFRPNGAVSGSAVDGIIIATPSNQHVVELLEMRPDLPALVEKPIGCTDGDMIFLRELLAPPRAPVMVGNNLRFHSCVKKAKGWLDADLIGLPIWANFTLAQYNDKYTDDVILNWGSHELDLARYLLGDSKVLAAAHVVGVADIILRHNTTCQTTVHLDYQTEPEARHFRIQGTDGFIACELTGQRRSVLWYAGQTEPQIECGEDSFDENYIEEMQAFIDRIDGKEALGATGEDGLAALELCLEAKRLAGI